MGEDAKIKDCEHAFTSARFGPHYRAPGDRCWACGEPAHDSLRIWFNVEHGGKKGRISSPACEACWNSWNEWRDSCGDLNE